MNVNKILKNASSLLVKKKFDKALNEFLSALKHEPNNDQVLRQVGNLYIRLNRVDEAVPHLYKVIEIYEDQMYYSKAIAVFNNLLLKHVADREDFQLHLARLYKLNNQISDARRILLKIAEAKNKKGDMAGVLKIYDMLIELDPSNPQLLLKLAELHQKENNSEKSIFYLSSLLQQLFLEDHELLAKTASRANNIVPGELQFQLLQLLGHAQHDEWTDAENLLPSIDIAGLEQHAIGQLFLYHQKKHQNMEHQSMINLALACKYSDEFSTAKLEKIFPSVQDYFNKLLEDNNYSQAIEIAVPLSEFSVLRGDENGAVAIIREVAQKDPNNITAWRKLVDIYKHFNHTENLNLAMERMITVLSGTNEHEAALTEINALLAKDPHNERWVQLKEQLTGSGIPLESLETIAEEPELGFSVTDHTVDSGAEPKMGLTFNEPISDDFMLEGNSPNADPFAPVESDAGDLSVDIASSDPFAVQDPGALDLDDDLLLNPPESSGDVPEPQPAQTPEEVLRNVASFLQHGGTQQAISLLVEAIEIHTEQPELLEKLGALYLEQMDTPKAMNVFAQAARVAIKSQDRPLFDRFIDSIDFYDEDLVATLKSEFEQFMGAPNAEASADFSDLAPPAPVAPVESDFGGDDLDISMDDFGLLGADVGADENAAEPNDGSDLGGLDLSDFNMLDSKIEVEQAGKISSAELENENTEQLPEEDQEELEEAVFLLDQGFNADAKELFDRLSGKYGIDHPALANLRLELGDAEEEVIPQNVDATGDKDDSLFFNMGDQIDLGMLAEELDQSAKDDLISDHAGEEEQHSISQLLSEFRKGVDSQVGTADFDTRYNLGIAYKEMGLYTEAEEEFKTVLSSPEHQIEAISLLAMLAMEQDNISHAKEWFEKGLALSDRTVEEYVAFKYELALAYKKEGDESEATALFTEIAIDMPGYRDVDALLTE